MFIVMLLINHRVVKALSASTTSIVELMVVYSVDVGLQAGSSLGAVTAKRAHHHVIGGMALHVNGKGISFLASVVAYLAGVKFFVDFRDVFLDFSLGLVLCRARVAVIEILFLVVLEGVFFSGCVFAVDF